MGKIPFIADNYRNRIPINWYPAKDDEKGVILWGTPGLQHKVTLLENKPVRGLREVDGVLYAVAGGRLYSITSEYVATDRGVVGGLLTTAGVIMEDNGTQLLIVIPGGGGYLYTIATATLSAVSFGFIPSSLAYQDGYFIASEYGTGKFYISGSYDGSTWDPLDYAVPEGAPDNLVRVLSDHRELWLFGNTSTEVWYNSGDTDFPFTRNQAGFVEMGCSAVLSAAKMDNSVVWLSNLGQLVRADGYVPKIISTRKLEREWQGYATISDAEGFAYLFEGHWFYHLVFPSAHKVWVYDAATGAWHERQSYLDTTVRHRGSCHALFGREHVVGDYQNGALYAMRSDVYLDNSQTITRVLETSTVSADGKMLFFPGLQIEFQAGYADQEGQGSDPQAMLQWSDDGGQNWSNEYWASIGKAGEYSRRSVWRRLGKSRDRVFRLTITDPVKANIVGWNLMQPRVGR
jgi:hypothetical protein